MAKVTLIAHTPDPERLIAASAKLCYSPASISDLMDGLDEEKTTSFLNMLSDFGHQSPIEHISFTFGIEEVSRTLLAQITRHRIASFSVQSQRYVKEKQFSFVTPPEIAVDEQASALYQQAMKSAHDSYLQLADIGSILQQNGSGFFAGSELTALRLFSARVGRLHEEALMLREYSTQIREVYQSQIDIRQNNIMKILTVVTAVFMPLTLIAGWYGMNFTAMPELSWKYGYAAVIILSGVTVSLCIYLCKKKHFL